MGPNMTSNLSLLLTVVTWVLISSELYAPETSAPYPAESVLNLPEFSTLKERLTD